MAGATRSTSAAKVENWSLPQVGRRGQLATEQLFDESDDDLRLLAVQLQGAIAPGGGDRSLDLDDLQALDVSQGPHHRRPGCVYFNHRGHGLPSGLASFFSHTIGVSCQKIKHRAEEARSDSGQTPATSGGRAIGRVIDSGVP